MPSLPDHLPTQLTHLASDPRSHPARYPGDRLASDFLLRDGRVVPLVVGRNGWRLGDGSPVDERIAVPLAARRPVVAFGSNAAPAQLIAKFGSAAGPIPVTRARLHGFVVGHSPHVSIPGYVPWVLVDCPDSVVDCAVLWLDDAQRVRLDATEPNYELVQVTAARYRLVVEAVDAVIDFAVYRGRWGALRWPDEPGPVPAGTQAVLFGRLAALGWFRDLVGVGDLVAVQRRLRAEGQLRDRLRAEFARRGMTHPDGWRSG